MNKNLIEVFQDTLAQSQFQYPISDTTKYNFNSILKDLYRDKSPTLTYKEDTSKIEVLPIDTVSAAVDFQGKVAILNMASAKRPGGGVGNGARAQEECLFRCSNLATSINPNFYPLKEDEALYTKDAIFFKDKNYDYMVPIKVDVITIPAVNLNAIAKYDVFQKTNNYEKLTKDKIRLMLSIPILDDTKSLILGAWGCGVFKNDPTKMAQYFYDVLIGEGYIKQLDKVIFAIINDHNSVGNNYQIFKSRF